MGPEIWLPIVTVTATFSGVVLSVRATRRKTRAEESQIIVTTAIELLQPLREEIEILREDVARLHVGVRTLLAQLLEAGIDPEWRP